MKKALTANEKKWDELARNGVLCSQPKLFLTPEEARNAINRNGHYHESLEGKNVLCLASGGGQQRELSFCADEEFDIVYQPYSINYIPGVDKVFDEVARVLKPGGIYDLMFHNPYVHGSWKDGCWEKEWRTDELWEGKGYPIWQPYKDGAPIKTVDPNWNFVNQEDKEVRIESPQEYRHTMSTIINGLISRGLEIISYNEEIGTAHESKPGTWEHYKSCLPPWIYMLSKKKKAN